MFKMHKAQPLYTVSQRTEEIHSSYIRSVAQRSASVVALGFGALLTIQGCLIFVLAGDDPAPVQILGIVVTVLGIASAVASFGLMFCSMYHTKTSVYDYIDLSQQYLCAACCDYYLGTFSPSEMAIDIVKS